MCQRQIQRNPLTLQFKTVKMNIKKILTFSLFTVYDFITLGIKSYNREVTLV